MHNNIFASSLKQKKDSAALSLFGEMDTAVKMDDNSFPDAHDPLAVKCWAKCVEIIKDNVSPHIFDTWFKPVKAVSLVNSELTVQVRSQFFYEWLEEHYYDLIQKTLHQILGEGAKLKYKVVFEDRSEDNPEGTIVKMPGLKNPPKFVNNVVAFSNSTIVEKEFENNLKPTYTFDNFITGESNQLATSAALAVAAMSANSSAKRYNPLVIYGDTGLGKTHLLCAIGNEVIKNHPKMRVLYINSERFTMEFVNSIQNNKTNDFIAFYRSIDLLLVDDIQFLAGKEKTQDNFFHTFNALHQAGKQLVLSSDRPPRELQDLDDRLISRFQWGLTVDIQKPDLETRMAILHKKSEDEGIELPQEIVEIIAHNVSTNIRELEGTLINMLAKVTLDRRELSVELAREVVQGMCKSHPKPLSIDEIKQAVSAYYKISIDQIESKTRKHEIALARQMCIYLAKQLTQNSLKTIGSQFGNRDHSTVLHSCQTIENYLHTDPTVKEAYNTLYKQVKKK